MRSAPHEPDYLKSSHSQDTFTRATPISAISASKNYSILTPKSNNSHSDISTKNIILKDVNFSQDVPNLNNQDFLNRLDEEIKMTEESVKQMNERFTQLQIKKELSAS